MDKPTPLVSHLRMMSNLNQVIEHDSEDVMGFVDVYLRAAGLIDDNDELVPDSNSSGVLELEIDCDEYSIQASSRYGENERANNLGKAEIDKTNTLSQKRKLENCDETEDLNRSKTQKIILNECSVCLESLYDKEIGSTMCGHVFCMNCLKSIAGTSKKCPACRKQVTLKKIHRLYL